MERRCSNLDISEDTLDSKALQVIEYLKYTRVCSNEAIERYIKIFHEYGGFKNLVSRLNCKQECEFSNSILLLQNQYENEEIDEDDLTMEELESLISLYNTQTKQIDLHVIKKAINNLKL